MGIQLPCQNWCKRQGSSQLLRLMTTRIFFLFFFLRDQNSQRFNEDLVVNASAFSFVLSFKVIDYVSASNYVISAK